MNGVIGWGLDAPEDINATFHALHRVLRPGCALLRLCPWSAQGAAAPEPHPTTLTLVL